MIKWRLSQGYQFGLTFKNWQNNLACYQNKGEKPIVSTDIKIVQKCPFIIATKNNKYLALNLTKYMLSLYNENYKTLMSEIKKWFFFKNLKRFEGIYNLLREQLNIVKISILSNLIVASIPIKAGIFVQIDKIKCV